MIASSSTSSRQLRSAQNRVCRCIHFDRKRYNVLVVVKQLSRQPLYHVSSFSKRSPDLVAVLHHSYAAFLPSRRRRRTRWSCKPVYRSFASAAIRWIDHARRVKSRCRLKSHYFDRAWQNTCSSLHIARLAAWHNVRGSHKIVAPIFTL